MSDVYMYLFVVAFVCLFVCLFTAQLDMSRSPEFLAVEELLKAQDTHMKLKRQFQETQIKEALAKRQEVKN